jgi:choloylglycine hydrolase
MNVGRVRNQIEDLRHTIIALVLALPAVSLFSLEAGACATFVVQTDDDLVFGRSLDWKTGIGMVIVNKRGLQKTSIALSPEQSISWISTYGSVTFNQVGKEMPYGGMNEAGLVVEEMTLQQTEYPPPDSRPIACEVQWIQFQLDNYSTVEEVIASDAVIRIGQADTKLHFLVADKKGQAATIEFLNGRMVVHTGESFPVPVLTNSSYGDGLWHLRANDFQPEEMPNFHIWRMAVAMKMIRAYQSRVQVDEEAPSAVDFSFSVLDSIRHKTTKWRVVYDIANMAIHFNTVEHRENKTINLRSFDFSCDTPARMIDMSIPEGGVIDAAFVDYDPDVNIATILRAFSEFRSAGVLEDYSDAELRKYASILDTYKCNRQ